MTQDFLHLDTAIRLIDTAMRTNGAILSVNLPLCTRYETHISDFFMILYPLFGHLYIYLPCTKYLSGDDNHDFNHQNKRRMAGGLMSRKTQLEIELHQRATRQTSNAFPFEVNEQCQVCKYFRSTWTKNRCVTGVFDRCVHHIKKVAR